MYSPNSKHSKSGIHGGERSKVFDINSHQLHSHWPPGSHLPWWLAPPIPTPPSPSTPGYTKSDGDPPLFSTPGYTNALAIHAPLTSIWTQSIDPAIIMRIRIETAKVRAIFKWVCRISMINEPKMTNIWTEHHIKCVMISMWFLSMGDIFYQIWLPFQVLLILPLLRDIVRDQWRLLAIGIWSNTPN